MVYDEAPSVQASPRKNLTAFTALQGRKITALGC